MDKITVMLADDHRLVRESIRKILADEPGITVVGEAGDGETAVELAIKLKPQVLLIDMDMPKLNGIQVTRKVIQCCPNIVVLILTAYDYEQYIFAAMEAGAAGYLLKDMSGRELVRAIEAVCRGESVLHPALVNKVLHQLQGSVHHAPPFRDSLTEREKEILILAARGLRNKEIGQQVFLSVRTVEAHLGKIFAKLEVSSRTEAILMALRKGLISLEQVRGGGEG
ncbi:MAG TPA: response regulator transcription factor [Bacillota bacterium]|nr:response regulator transcription factor [Bacillota bacterium]